MPSLALNQRDTTNNNNYYYYCENERRTTAMRAASGQFHMRAQVKPKWRVCATATTTTLAPAPRVVRASRTIKHTTNTTTTRTPSLVQKQRPGSAVTVSRAVAEGAAAGGSAGQSAGNKRYVVITGSSSGLGLRCAACLAKSGTHHVIMACRDFSKAERMAQEFGMPKGSYTVMHLDLGSLQSVRTFVKNYKNEGYPIDALVCNAAVYLPTNPEPTFTAEGYENSVGTNHLGHFLLCHLLVEEIAKSKDPRIIIVGSVTGNTNTLAGQVPPLADLGDLRGFEGGLRGASVMIDGGEYDGAKAYKDSKVCNMLTMREMDKRWNEKYGITFGSLYPGCVAETNLFREKRAWFRWLFPRFQKYVTKGYVSQEEAGERLAQVVSAPEAKKSGRYWSWNGEAKSIGEGSAGGSGGALFENEPSDEVTDDAKAEKLWDYSMKAVGLA